MNPRQAEVLAFLKSFQAERGYSPTIAEIGQALNMCNTDAGKRVRDLRQMGLVKRRHDKSLYIVGETDRVTTDRVTKGEHMLWPGVTGDNICLPGSDAPSLADVMFSIGLT